MEGGYDELLLENPFFIELKNEYSNLLQHCISESWILCVPRIGRLNRCVFTAEDFCAHILVPSDELPETHYSTLTEKQVTVANRVITVELTKGLPLRSHILFEETFYTEDFLKYKVWCIERPLEPTAKLSENVVTKVCLTSINDCIDLLWTQAAGRQVLDKIEANVHSFIRNHPLPLTGLRALKDSTSELYTECLQAALQNHRLREKYKISNHLLENIKLAVETYMQYLLFNSNFKLICTGCSYEDAHLNKKIRNMSDIQLRHLDIKKELYHAVPKATHLLSKIYTYNTVLEKIICLKQALNAINMLDDSNNITYYLTVDDLLPVLVYLLIKSEVPNWYSQLQYMKEFRFSSMGKKDGDVSDFLITTLEAVVEHILSGALAELPNPEAYYYNSKLTLDNLNSNKRRHSLTESVSTTDTNSREENLEYVFDLIKANCTDRVSSLLEKNRKLLEDFEKNEIYALKLTAHDEEDDDADYDDNDADYDDNGENEGEIYQKLCHPLCICKKCCSKILKNLRRTTPTVTSRDRHGLTPLHVASIHGKAVIVDILINMRANVSATDVNEFTPLHYAASRGHQNALLLLLHSGANINKTNIDKNTPLHLAVNNGHIKCVKALIYFAEHGRIKLNVNCINDSGNTPLHFASKWGYGGIVKILIENGADPSLQNANNKTAFDYAHNFKIMQVLKSYSPNMYEYFHITSSDIKTLKCNPDSMVKLKLQHLKIGHESDNASKTVENLKRLERIFQAIAYSDVKLACFFFGIDYEDYSNYCDPPCECYFCKKRCAKPLDLDINFADIKYGFTSLHYAAKYDLVELCHILMSNKANVNASNKTGKTPLHLAALNTETVVLRFLLEHGANLNAIDSSGNTPLHDACAMGNIVTTMALLRYNPDISLLNGANKSASDLARENLHLTVFDLIEKYANKKEDEKEEEIPDVYYRYNIDY